MSAKAIRVSDDAGATWYTLPGNSGSFQSNAESINDTIFGADYMSNESGLITWEMSAPAFFKGFAGYLAKILAPGTSTAVVGGALTLVSGKTYQINTAAQQIMDRAATITVYDNGVDETAQVDSIDFLFGKVTFKATYTVTGPVTIDYNYLPTVQLGKGQSYTLTMTAADIDTTDFATAQANNGHRTYDSGLKTVALEIGGVFDSTVNSRSKLVARDELIVEIDPAGDGSSIARGFFKYNQVQQQGDVGALEAETLQLQLNVPEDPNFNISEYFNWVHTNSTLSTAVQKLMTAFLSGTTVTAQYLPQGSTGQTPLDGKQGTAIVTSLSLKGGLSDMNTFEVTLRGSGEVTEV